MKDVTSWSFPNANTFYICYALWQSISYRMSVFIKTNLTVMLAWITHNSKAWYIAMWMTLEGVLFPILASPCTWQPKNYFYFWCRPLVSSKLLHWSISDSPPYYSLHPSCWPHNWHYSLFGGQKEPHLLFTPVENLAGSNSVCYHIWNSHGMWFSCKYGFQKVI